MGGKQNLGGLGQGGGGSLLLHLSAVPTTSLAPAYRPASKMGFPKYFPSMTPSAASKALATGPCVLFSTVLCRRKWGDSQVSLMGLEPEEQHVSGTANSSPIDTQCPRAAVAQRSVCLPLSRSPRSDSQGGMESVPSAWSPEREAWMFGRTDAASGYLSCGACPHAGTQPPLTRPRHARVDCHMALGR